MSVKIKVNEKNKPVDTPCFIYVLRLLPEYWSENSWTDTTRQIISRHFEYLKRLTEKGQVILAGRTDYTVDNPANFGIIVFNATDPEEARQLMKDDPAIRQGLMKAELHPFSIALMAGMMG